MKTCEHLGESVEERFGFCKENIDLIKKRKPCTHCLSNNRLLVNLNTKEIVCECKKVMSGVCFSLFFNQFKCFECRMVFPVEKFYLSHHLLEQLNLNRVLGCTGLVNLGNTCFINVILQVMSNLVCVNKLFTNFVSVVSKTLKLPSEFALTNEFCSVLQSLWIGNQTFSPLGFIRCFDQQFSALNRHRHQDSSEFFKLLYDYLEITLASTLKTNFLRECFMWKIKTLITCTHCKQVKTSSEEFIELPLSIPKKDKISKLRVLSDDSLTPRDQKEIKNASRGVFKKVKLLLKSKTTTIVSLYDCLNEYFQNEKMDDPKNLVMCEKCGCGRESIKSQIIDTLPSVLTLQFKRYLNPGKKYPIHIQLPNELNLSKFSETNPKSYSLTCIVTHKGDMNSGHYIAYCKNRRSKQWYKFDDRGVQLRTEDQILAQQVYLAFYTEDYSKKKLNQRKDCLVPTEWGVKYKYLNNPGMFKVEDYLCKHGKILKDLPISYFTSADSGILRRDCNNIPIFREDIKENCTQCAENEQKLKDLISQEYKIIKSLTNEENYFFIKTSWWQDWTNYKNGYGKYPGSIVNKDLINQQTPKNMIKIKQSTWTVLMFFYSPDFEINCQGSHQQVTDSMISERFSQLDKETREKLINLKENKLKILE